MSSRKRKRAENTADIRVFVGKENEDPDCKAPKRKQGKKAKSQSPPRSALGVNDQNGRQSPVISEKKNSGRSSNISPHKTMGMCANEMNKENGGAEVSAHLPHSGFGSPMRPRNKEKSEDQDPNQLLYWEKEIFEKNHGTHSPPTPRVDDCFPKIYKKGSPKNTRENPERSSGSITDINMILSERSKSVCKIDVTGAGSNQGTGFVLVDYLIMTCAHLFRGFLEGKELKDDINVSLWFNFDGPQPISNSFVFAVEKIIVAINKNLDYILLKLKPKPNQRVPPGLLEQFGPLPDNGKIFIIGHPRGEAKRYNSTVIIELGMRQRAVYKHLSPLKDNFVEMFQAIKDQGIQDVMNGGVKEKEVETYVTREMYEGASGSPVFNSDGQLTLMHTGGFGYSNPYMVHSVLEYSQRLDLIIPDLVDQLKESGNVQLLSMIEFVASKNEHLKRVLEAEPMEVD